jgi:hypothetical protein
MGSKPKVRSTAKQAKKASKKEAKSQRERFIETARAIGVDETGIEFEKGLRQLLPEQPRLRRTK